MLVVLCSLAHHHVKMDGVNSSPTVVPFFLGDCLLLKMKRDTEGLFVEHF